MGKKKFQNNIRLFFMAWLFWFILTPAPSGIADATADPRNMGQEEMLDGFEEGFKETDPFSDIDTSVPIQ
ncbi:MAG: hypothetical protein KKE61_12345, partial [Proteobacteria bacterium]|nr:hypothetical protein [Pseudomonadota bacterium]